jgi:glycosyltransferase involved in cell wall biosynthesis
MYFAAPIAKLVGVLCVIRFRVNLGYWMRPIDRPLTRFYNRFIDATLVNCNACRDAVIEQERAAPESITIIPNGVDLVRFQNTGTERPWESDGQQIVGVVANLRHVKGLDVFIGSASILAARHENIRFVIAGEGDLRKNLESLILHSGLQDRFELLGRIDDVPRFLHGVDIAVLCSRSEGAPNVIMEYMASGKPIVATAVGGIGEMIVNKVTGLLVPPDEPVLLADAIDYLYRNSDFAAQLASAARRRAIRDFGIDVQARRYEKFYCRSHLAVVRR